MTSVCVRMCVFQFIYVRIVAKNWLFRDTNLLGSRSSDGGGDNSCYWIANAYNNNHVSFVFHGNVKKSHRFLLFEYIRYNSTNLIQVNNINRRRKKNCTDHRQNRNSVGISKFPSSSFFIANNSLWDRKKKRLYLYSDIESTSWTCIRIFCLHINIRVMRWQ